MAEALVAGGAGSVGNHLGGRLLAEVDDVVCVDDAQDRIKPSGN